VAKRPGRIQRFLRWLFGSPFENISDVIGDPVPPELRAFEARVDAMQHHPEAKVAVATFHSDRTKSA
jgi:hypothetical protein